MRIAATLAPVLVFPLAVWGQAPASSDVEHFEGWPDASWGADKQTFDGRFWVGGWEVTLTVAANGFGWHRTFTDSKSTFNAWADVTAWCWAPGTVAFRTRQRSPLHVYDLDPEDLLTVVDGYFKKYAAESEWSAPEWQCTSAALNRPHPAATSKIIELLEAASPEPR